MCIKGNKAGIYCNCDSCMTERAETIRANHEKWLSYRTDLTANLRHYWTDQYTRSDKSYTEIMLGAGFEPLPLTDEEKDEMADCGC